MKFEVIKKKVMKFEVMKKKVMKFGLTKKKVMKFGVIKKKVIRTVDKESFQKSELIRNEPKHAVEA